MRTLVAPGTPAARIIAEELELWARVSAFLQGRETGTYGLPGHDAELLELRDAIAEAKPEDVASLVEQMMRVSAVAAGRRGKAAPPLDVQAPYFGHLRLRPAAGSGTARDVLIGRRGLIDRHAGVHIVDWRDAPVSQIYYRYDEGDDYEEELPAGKLCGVVEVRRNVTIQGGRLRRIGCPQGNFFCDAQDRWWSANTGTPPALAGGQGVAIRPARPPAGAAGRAERRAHLGLGAGFDRPLFSERVDKHLPEIAALIDAEQFALIARPESGLVVIQGGAGSGKTTVALHRVAYLSYQDPKRFRDRRMLVVVPSAALVRYVSGVLPALGVGGVPVVTTRSFLRGHRRRLLPALPTRETEEAPPAVARLKKHPRMPAMLDRYVEEQAAWARRELAQALGGAEAAALPILAEWDRRAQQPLASRCRALQRLLGQRSPDLGDAGGGGREALLRAEEAMRRVGRRVRDVGRDWAEFVTDLEGLRRGFAGEGPGEPVREQELQELYAWCRAQQEEPPEVPGDADADPERYQAVDGRPLDEDSPAGRLDPEDDALLVWLSLRKHGGIELHSGERLRYEHLVIDEAQDLSVLEVKILLSLVGKEGADGSGGPSVTIAGDGAQRLVFDNGFESWERLLALCGVSGRDAEIRRLRLLYRSTVEVMALAQEVLGPLRSAESTERAVRHGAPVGAFLFDEMGEAVAFLAEALRSLLSREPTASVALLARHAGTADAYHRALLRAEVPALRRVEQQEFPFTPGVDVTDVTQVKGLEFDYVVVLDATAAAYPDAIESRHLLHIAVTRCAHQLWLLAAGPPTPLVPASHFERP